MRKGLFISATLILLSAMVASAQTTAFSYQGKLTDAGSPASGSFQMQFKLFDAASGGTQQGPTLNDVPVTVTAGSFSVKLDFGAGGFPGADRWLEVAVRHNSGENYTVLAPREQIASSPHAIRTLSALDSDKLGGVNASEYVTTSSAGNSFIKNATTQQTASFNISGNGFFGGSVGVGTTTPTHTLDVNGFFRASHVAGGNVVSETTGGVNSWAKLWMKTPVQSWSIGSSHTFNGNQLYFSNETASAIRMAIMPNGNVGIGTIAPSQRFHVDSGNMLVRGTNNFAANGDRAIVYLGDTNNYITGVYGSGLRIGSFAVGDAITLLHTSGNVGIGTTTPTQKLDVAGTTKTNILQITGGSDLAEKFEVTGNVKPGRIVSIDPRNAGKLILSRGAYDRQVAGVISGANNLSAGMLLPDLKESENSHPVALSGRVWVYADARNGPIRPGDLLTSSATPGHAMRVVSYKRAQGAIIGKAMSGLRSGRGLVLVLVSMQ